MDISTRLSFQLYSARNFPPLDTVFGVLADLGYRNVETYGAQLGEIDALVEGLARHGLKAPSAHVGLAQLRETFDDTVKSLHRLGTNLAIVPYLAADQRPADAEGWRVLGRELAEIRKKLAGQGLRLGWHNHDFEVLPIDGVLPMTVLLETDPELLWECDIGWLVRAGEDPLAWLTKWGHRIAALHVKDVAPQGKSADEDGWADVGHGAIDWKRLSPAMAADLWIVEHDNPSDFERFARRSRASIASW